MKKLLNESCTACGACALVCSKNCIHLEHDKLNNLQAYIDEKQCVHCNQCEKVCHLYKKVQKNEPEICYVSYAKDGETRNMSSSGGVATAVYYYALEEEIQCFGVVFDCEKKIAEFVQINNGADISLCKGSKYVYSYLNDTFLKVKQNLKQGKRTIFIGLPCQVAALLAYLGNRHENLLCIDIICHGVASDKYLQQHIQAIEKKKKRQANGVFFRDPRYGTNQYYFTLYEGQNCFYKKKVSTNDGYQIGYHKAVIYRDNCYQCQYACQERVGDLTIGDFSGLGRVVQWEGSKENVSCILVSTQKGKGFLNKLNEYVALQERPIEEAFKYERQLQAPSTVSCYRERFVDSYAKTQDFAFSIKNAVAKEIRKNNLKNFFCVKKIKSIIVKIVPKKIKCYIKRRINKINEH